jgi:Cyclic nucleotide-binding domain
VRKKVKASFDPKEFLVKVGDGRTISKYRKNQIVFSQGEVADAVFYIQQGKIKLTVVSEQGKEAVVAILGPGHFFGEGCLNGHPRRIATTRAVDECVITRLVGSLPCNRRFNRAQAGGKMPSESPPASSASKPSRRRATNPRKSRPA